MQTIQQTNSNGHLISVAGQHFNLMKFDSIKPKNSDGTGHNVYAGLKLELHGTEEDILTYMTQNNIVVKQELSMIKLTKEYLKQ